MSDAFAPAAAAIALQPPPLGLNVLRRALMEKAKADLAGGLIGEDFAGFQKKVIELGKEKDKGPLTKFVNEVIASRGWFRGATTEPRDTFNLADDGGMAALKEVYLKVRSAQDPLAIEFGNMFMLDPVQMGGVTTYNPQEFMKGRTDETKETKYVFWLTEDRDARVPRFDKAKPQVLEAWKRQKARELAQKEVDRLKDKAKGSAATWPSSAISPCRTATASSWSSARWRPVHASAERHARRSPAIPVADYLAGEDRLAGTRSPERTDEPAQGTEGRSHGRERYSEGQLLSVVAARAPRTAPGRVPASRTSIRLARIETVPLKS